MKGFFQFKRERKQFDLNISLYHFEGNAKFLDGTPSGFVAPRAGQRGMGHLEAQFKIPFIVFASREETGLWEKLDRVPFDKLSADEQRLVTSTARAYKISIPQAINEWFEQILGEVDKESGSLLVLIPAHSNTNSLLHEKNPWTNLTSSTDFLFIKE